MYHRPSSTKRLWITNGFHYRPTPWWLLLKENSLHFSLKVWNDSSVFTNGEKSFKHSEAAKGKLPLTADRPLSYKWRATVSCKHKKISVSTYIQNIIMSLLQQVTNWFRTRLNRVYPHLPHWISKSLSIASPLSFQFSFTAKYWGVLLDRKLNICLFSFKLHLLIILEDW